MAMAELVQPVAAGESANGVEIEVLCGPRHAMRRVPVCYDAGHVTHVLARRADAHDS